VKKFTIIMYFCSSHPHFGKFYNNPRVTVDSISLKFHVAEHMICHLYANILAYYHAFCVNSMLNIFN